MSFKYRLFPQFITNFYVALYLHTYVKLRVKDFVFKNI